jgi:hypothetical protein
MTTEGIAPAGADTGGRTLNNAHAKKQALPQNTFRAASSQVALQTLEVATGTGDIIRIQIIRDDAHWREKALARIRDPLSPAACAIRKYPMTLAERLAWDAECRVFEQILLYRALTEARREFEGAAP